MDEHTAVPNKTLDTFISKKFHWKTLSPSMQRSMAIELRKSRIIIDTMLKEFGAKLDNDNDNRLYRRLVEVIGDDK